MLKSIVTKLLDYIKALPLYCLPQYELTAIVYKLTRIENAVWKNTLIKIFIKLFKVDMEQAIWKSEKDYSCFNAFFTRHLKPDARSWEKDINNILSPVDGTISQIGKIDKDSLIQAKGLNYSLKYLLANDDAAEHFQDGSFTTLYLSPKDYHRIHMPTNGKLIKTLFVPGDLFSVNNASVRTIENLFTRNERFICLFETELGLMAQIMVGAMFVGSMETVFAGQITPTKNRKIVINDYEKNPIRLDQGDEFGHFNMGSTVILIFEKNKLLWSEKLKETHPVQVGQIIGNVY